MLVDVLSLVKLIAARRKINKQTNKQTNKQAQNRRRARQH